MQKTLRVTVDASTWPKGRHPPATLLPTNKRVSINILDMMLRIGSLAIPPQSLEMSINSWWAWLRYASAFAANSSFLLKGGYSDLDAHQKTLLSDDFGMGVALTYLVPSLDLQTLYDGRYFIQFLAPAVGATAVQIAKNGQFKSPDFIGQDASGRWHAIECKGTQTSTQARSVQLASGRLQKTNVTFPSSSRGEKLVSALLIGREGGGMSSSLRIEDPEGDLRINVTKRLLGIADEAARRATLARALGVVGFPALAAIIAAPYGEHPSDRETTGADERLRLTAVERKLDAAEPELKRETLPTSDRFMDQDKVGRQITLSLPLPISTSAGRFGTIYARLSMPRSVLDLARAIVAEEPADTAAALKEINVSGMMSETTETAAILRIGDIFEAELSLLP